MVTPHQEAANIAHERAVTRDPLNWVDCAECGGEGVQWNNADPTSGQSVPCPECDGSGGHEWTCPKCNNGILADYSDCIVCDFIGTLPDKFGIEYDSDFAKQVADLLWAEANKEKSGG